MVLIRRLTWALLLVVCVSTGCVESDPEPGSGDSANGNAETPSTTTDPNEEGQGPAPTEPYVGDVEQAIMDEFARICLLLKVTAEWLKAK